MDNQFNYSKNFQPYLGYDKYEYDIKLVDGTIIENCYPNAGKFLQINSNTYYDESLVVEIRFSINSKLHINDDE